MKRARYGIALLLLPLLLQTLGDHWVRTADTCLLYLTLALGMNIVVGYAGLLDLGYVAFYAVGAYVFALLNSSHLTDNLPALAALFPAGLHLGLGLSALLAVVLTAVLGVALGAPTLRLRGDYLAVVTLAFGEIVRLLVINLDHPINLTNGAKGVGPIDNLNILGLDLGHALLLGPWRLSAVTLHYYLFLALALGVLTVSARLQDSRIGRAWRAMRDDEVSAEAMGLDTRRLKLLAFGLGASFGGLAGVLFGAFQGFISPEAFSLQESIFIVALVVFGGAGHLPGVVLGAVVLSGLPEVLRYVSGPLQVISAGRLDAGVTRPLLIAIVTIGTMLFRPTGVWPAPERHSSR
jgi:branched-chain amino acid transport system permease protein